jgi:hypothetical protein
MGMVFCYANSPPLKPYHSIKLDAHGTYLGGDDDDVCGILFSESFKASYLEF